MHLTVNFGTNGYGFKFMRGRFEKSPLGIASMNLFIPVGELAASNPPKISCFDNFTHEELLNIAKGIFHLGLLDAKVEKVLGVTISEHERLEWLLEKDLSEKPPSTFVT